MANSRLNWCNGRLFRRFGWLPNLIRACIFLNPRRSLEYAEECNALSEDYANLMSMSMRAGTRRGRWHVPRLFFFPFFDLSPLS